MTKGEKDRTNHIQSSRVCHERQMEMPADLGFSNERTEGVVGCGKWGKVLAYADRVANTKTSKKVRSYK